MVLFQKRLDDRKNFGSVAIFAAFSYYVTAGRIDICRTLYAWSFSLRINSLRDRRKREDFYDVQSGLFPVRLFLRNAFRTLLRLDRCNRSARRNRSAGRHGDDGCYRTHGCHRSHGRNRSHGRHRSHGCNRTHGRHRTHGRNRTDGCNRTDGTCGRSDGGRGGGGCSDDGDDGGSGSCSQLAVGVFACGGHFAKLKERGSVLRALPLSFCPLTALKKHRPPASRNRLEKIPCVFAGRTCFFIRGVLQ